MTLVQRETATTEECAAALRALSDADLQRVEELARLRAVGLASLDWRDLLHEAMVRMLTGKRRWPRDVPLVVFLRETMRSIASNQRRQQETAAVVAESETRADPETGDGAVAMAADSSTAPEARTAAAQTLARIEALFEDDADALAVMAGMASGQSPAEIRQEHAMDETRYASTQRRVRRGLARAFPERGEGT